MTPTTESRKAAVERFIERAEDMIASLASPDRVALFADNSDRVITTAGDIRHLMDAARRGIEAEPEPEVKAPACIFCGGECEIQGGDESGKDTGAYWVTCPNANCGLGPNAPTRKAAVEAFLRPAHLPGASRPEPPPSEVPIGRGSIRIEPGGPGLVKVSGYIPECVSPAFAQAATPDQLDALAALASRVAAEVRKAVGR